MEGCCGQRNKESTGWYVSPVWTEGHPKAIDRRLPFSLLSALGSAQQGHPEEALGRQSQIGRKHAAARGWILPWFQEAATHVNGVINTKNTGISHEILVKEGNKVTFKMGGLLAVYPWSNFMWSRRVSACKMGQCGHSIVLWIHKGGAKRKEWRTYHLPQAPVAAEQIIKFVRREDLQRCYVEYLNQHRSREQENFSALNSIWWYVVASSAYDTGSSLA